MASFCSAGQVALSEHLGKSTKSHIASHHFPTELAIKWGYTVNMVFPVFPIKNNAHHVDGFLDEAVQERLGSLRSAFDAAERRARAPEAWGEVRAD